MQRATTTHSDPQQSHRKLTSVTILVKFELIEFFLYTLCFIYNKIIISSFYGHLFLFFNALLFSFVK